MKKLKVFTLLFLVVGIGIVSGFGLKRVSAETRTNVGIFQEVTPDWASNDLAHIETEFDVVSAELGEATKNLEAFDFGKARVMLLQEFGTKVVVMNETKGKAFIIDNEVLITHWRGLPEAEQGVILAPVIADGTDSLLLLDNQTLRLTGTTVTVEDNFVGKLDATINKGTGTDLDAINHRSGIDYANAYIFAQNYHSESLGLPITDIIEKSHNAYKVVNGSGSFVVDELDQEVYVKESRRYFVQEFENGFIMMNHGLNAIHLHWAPAPITKNMHARVIAITDNANFEVTGVPTSREYYVGDSIFQNFEFGFVEFNGIETTFTFNKSVSPTGVEMPRIIGAPERWVNWNYLPYNLETLLIGYEMLRMTEEFRAYLGGKLEAGIATFETDNDIHNLAHRLDNTGAGHIFKKGTGQAKGFGNSFVLTSFWWNGVYEVHPFLNLIHFDNTKTIGIPMEEGKVFRDVTYQRYDKGYIYRKVGEDGVGVGLHGTDLEDFMEGSETFEEALVANGVVVIPGEVITGTYKFLTYELNNVEANIYYENEDNQFTINGKLLEAWLGDLKDENPSFEMIVGLNGAPVWADEEILITTTKVFRLVDGVVEETLALGQLPAGTEKVFGETDYNEKNAALITDAFTDAYLFAYDRGNHNLGLPLSDAVLTSKEIDGVTEYALVQEFENGQIMMGGFNRVAVPIYGSMLEAWNKAEADGGLGGLEGISAPTSRQFMVGEDTFQNFKYGYAKIDKDGVVTMEIDFVNGSAVDYTGKEMSANVGVMESRANIAKGHAEFEHELLRVLESYVTAYSNLVAQGFKVYTGEVRTGHEWNANGLTQSFTVGDSTSNAWGQSKFTVIVMKSPFMEAQAVRNAILDQYSMKGNNAENNLGLPTTADYTVKHTVTVDGENHDILVSYQNFEFGYIRTYVVGFTEYSEEFANAYVDAEGNAFSLENDEELVHELDLSYFDEEEPVDPVDPIDPVDPKPETPSESGSLTWLWITLGVVVVALGAAGTVIFLKKRNQ